MTVYRLGRDLLFPPPHEADASGLLAVGGDLSPERLLLAYSLGIFPWYDESQPILWHAPDPRAVLVPSRLHASRRLLRRLRRGEFELQLDTDFPRVIRACASVKRRFETGTWITPDMIAAYERLFALGFAHCAEARCDGELVGGIYGVSLGGCFFAESMFSLRTDASKAVLAMLARQLARWEFDLIDCQIQSDHLASLGTVEWSRARFGETLARSLGRPTRRGRWRLDPCDWRNADEPS